LAAAVGATACEPTNPLATDLGGVVLTLVDSGQALGSARTFAVPDTIVDVPVNSTAIDHSFDHQVIADVRRHFVSLGWRDVSNDSGARPDVVVLVAASQRTETGVAYFDWFGAWGYLPYWGPTVDASWVWGVPGAALPYAYQAGTVLITMLDLREQRTDSKSIPLLWAATLDGIVTSTNGTADRVVRGVDQAFQQSPYLRVP